MPIVPQQHILKISQADSHELDYQMMRMAFNDHNELGRFYDEAIYKNELELQCHGAGIGAIKEFEIKLIHGDFQKPLFIDLLVNGSTVYELKAAKSIAEPHRMQALNYLFASNTQNGKLINFRPPSVEHEFVSTHLTMEKRVKFMLCEGWRQGDHADRILNILSDLLKDWGAFLDTDIYLDALCHFLGGKDAVIRPVAITRGGTVLGHQQVPHLSDTEAFCLTSVSKNMAAYKDHLTRFLTNTQFECIHWINFNRSKINFETLPKKSFCP